MKNIKKTIQKSILLGICIGLTACSTTLQDSVSQRNQAGNSGYQTQKNYGQRKTFNNFEPIPKVAKNSYSNYQSQPQKEQEEEFSPRKRWSVQKQLRYAQKYGIQPLPTSPDSQATPQEWAIYRRELLAYREERLADAAFYEEQAAQLEQQSQNYEEENQFEEVDQNESFWSTSPYQAPIT